MNKPLDQIELEEEILNTHSQMEIATMIMTRKKYIYNNDVAVVIGGHTYDTTGCENESDFLNKYHHQLTEDGIKKFSISNINDGEKYVINIDELNTNIPVRNDKNEEENPKKNFSITTEGCNNIADFKIKNQETFNQILPEITNQILEEIEKKFENKVEETKSETSENQNTINLELDQLNLELNHLLEEQTKYRKREKVYAKIRTGELSLDNERKYYSTPSFEERERKLNDQLNLITSNYEIDEKTRQNAINTVKEEWNQLQEQKQTILANVDTLAEQNNMDLQTIEEKINEVKKKIELAEQNIVNASHETDNVNSESNQPTENLPGSSAPDRMLPKNKLEDDYYKRLENAAKEGPIFHDNELDFNITPPDSKPHIIKNIAKAPAKLINKIKDSKFGKLVSRGVEFIKKHKIKSSIVATATLLTALGIAKLVSHDNNDIQVQESIVASAETVAQDAEDMSTKQENIENMVAVTNPIMQSTEEKTDDQNFNKELEKTLNNILDGESRVYTSSDNAINNINGKLPTDSQLDNSWANATPGAYYTMEDRELQKITEEEAHNYWQDGGTVAVRMDNNGTPIGFVPVEQQDSIPPKGM